MTAATVSRGRYAILAGLLVATIINSFDRASLSVAAPFIIADFGVSKTMMGVALSAFFWTYIAGNLLGGQLADRFGGVRVFAGGLAIWSLFSAATGLAQNVGHLVLARLGVGLGEGPSFPCSTKILAGAFPSQQRGMAIGVNAAGARVGLMLCPLVMVMLIAFFGWRAAFFITGAISLLWAVAWVAIARRAWSGGQPRAVMPRANWRRVLGSRALLSLALVKFTQDFLQWMFLSWTPTYLIEGRGYSASEMAFYTSLAFGAAFLVQPVVGILSDRLIRAGWSVNRARKTVQVGLQMLSATILITAFTTNQALAMVFLVVAIAAESACAGHLWTIIADVVPERRLGGISGIINALGAVAGILSPIVTGQIVDRTGTFTAALATGGVLILVGSVLLVFVVPRLEAPWPDLFEEEPA